MQIKLWFFFFFFVAFQTSEEKLLHDVFNEKWVVVVVLEALTTNTNSKL